MTSANNMPKEQCEKIEESDTAILELEKRTEQLLKEMAQLDISVRNEIKKLKHNTKIFMVFIIARSSWQDYFSLL